MTQKNKRAGIVYYGTFPEKNLAEERMAARELLKKGFMEFFGRQFCDAAVKIGRHGKPYYEGCPSVQFNMSHCKTGAAVVVSDVPVGIDIEGMRRVNRKTVLNCCNSSECFYVFTGDQNRKAQMNHLSNEETKRFLKLWTLKESYVKMTGEGLSHTLKEISFDLQDVSEKINEPIFLADRGEANSSCLYLTEQFCLALTVWKKGNSGIRNFEWKPYDLSDKIEV